MVFKLVSQACVTKLESSTDFKDLHGMGSSPVDCVMSIVAAPINPSRCVNGLVQSSGFLAGLQLDSSKHVSTRTAQWLQRMTCSDLATVANDSNRNPWANRSTTHGQPPNNSRVLRLLTPCARVFPAPMLSHTHHGRHAWHT